MSGFRGSKPGERRGGRQKGTPNKATADLKALLDKHVPEAIMELARLATKARSEQARVAAIKEMFDRRFGKAHQSADILVHDGETEELTDGELTRIVLSGGAAGSGQGSTEKTDGTTKPSGMVH
jgi:hypothetical protein